MIDKRDFIRAQPVRVGEGFCDHCGAPVANGVEYFIYVGAPLNHHICRTCHSKVQGWKKPLDEAVEQVEKELKESKWLTGLVGNIHRVLLNDDRIAFKVRLECPSEVIEWVTDTIPACCLIGEKVKFIREDGEIKEIEGNI